MGLEGVHEFQHGGTRLRAFSLRTRVDSIREFKLSGKKFLRKSRVRSCPTLCMNSEHSRSGATSFVHDPIAFQTIDWTGFLDREQRSPSWIEWNEFVGGKTIMITGAGGSIGSALANVLMNLPVATLLLVDRSEDNLGALQARCRQRESVLPELRFIHADILQDEPLAPAFGFYEPNIIYHAAGLKDLAALELEPFHALETNLIGTLRLLHLADCAEVEHFVYVSTDKAVQPTSMLGVSKRISELFLLVAASPQVHRISLRLGNVLGSSGSVVPIAIDALQNGTTIPVTEPIARRFFITAEEAVGFLLDSLRIPESTVLVPEMGKPRKVIDLLSFLALRYDPAGLDHRFNVIGLRDGEKLSEQLVYEYEQLENTVVDSLYRVVDSRHLDIERFEDNVEHLFDLVAAGRKRGLVEAMSSIVPEFEASPGLLGYLNSNLTKAC
jgi:FlaA1/EpsC-like NDP-sugar epimerase